MEKTLHDLIRYWETYLLLHPITYESELQDNIKETIKALKAKSTTTTTSK